MPSMTTHSPYEKLTFFQSVARHGAHVSALHDISSALKQNEHINQNAGFDTSRLSVQALGQLHDDLVRADSDEHAVKTNGGSDTGERSPKRRKLSPQSQIQELRAGDNEEVVRRLVDLLYERYKQDVVQEIRKDEEAYTRLQNEIKTLEQETEVASKKTSQIQAATGEVAQERESIQDIDHNSAEDSSAKRLSIASEAQVKGSPTDQLPLSTDAGDNGSKSQSFVPKPSSPLRPDSVRLRPNNAVSQARSMQPNPSTVDQAQPTDGFLRQQPSPSPQRSSYAPVQLQSGRSIPSPAAAPATGIQQRPAQPAPTNSSQGRNSPMSFQGHPYPPYPHYPPHQWHPHIPAQQYQQHPTYGPVQYYATPPPARQPQTPQQIAYPPYPHTAPIQYMQPHHGRGQQQWSVHPASTSATPISRIDSRTATPGSGSSTPWKKRQQQQSNQPRQRSPPRPERDVSPLTDREDSPLPDGVTDVSKRDTMQKQEGKLPAPRQSRRPGRPPSVTPSVAGLSRSQSLASRASEIQNDKQISSMRAQKIKAEPPTTPLPLPSSDNEQQQRSSGRRGRPRGTTTASQADVAQVTAAMKRKRNSTSPTSHRRSPSQASATPLSRRINQLHDPSLIIASKNFSKTAQLLLNEITSHKLAGIFAKPLSERDAPSYKDLVLRPQDLKSIKAAVGKGSRAALAAIEAVETGTDLSPTQVQPTNKSDTAAGSIGHGFYLVPKTTDLIPPKGIVNSAQLEMELIRMFANAVMFNPLSSSERGFGRNLRLRRGGGDVDARPDPDEFSTADSESGSSVGSEEGGIIADAREMFNDVVQIVGKWRRLEEERMRSNTEFAPIRTGMFAAPTLPSNDNVRHPSLSVSSNMGEEDIMMGESETANTPVQTTSSSVGTARKRRRIADH